MVDVMQNLNYSHAASFLKGRRLIRNLDNQKTKQKQNFKILIRGKGGGASSKFNFLFKKNVCCEKSAPFPGCYVPGQTQYGVMKELK